jgi:hypothetical protein
MFIRPDIGYAVQHVYLHMHDPREPQLTAMKRILRYLHGTLDFGLLVRCSASSKLTIYTNVDWAGCPDTHCVPQQQPCLLIFEASEHRLPVEHQDRVPDRGQCRSGGLLAPVATSGAPCSANEEHPLLL